MHLYLLKYQKYYNAYYRLNFMLKKSFNRDKFLKDLEKKISVRVGSCPTIYKEKYFVKKKLYVKTLSFGQSLNFFNSR